MTINRDQLEPVTKLDPRYSQPNAVATPWPVTEAALEAAELAWLVTVRPDGRPHGTPVVPVWLDNAIHFTTGDDEQKGVNLRADNRVMVQVGGLDWQSGIDIAVEGRASLVTDSDRLARLATAFRKRWDGDWQWEAHDGALHHPSGGPVLTYSVRPERALAFTQGTFSHTSYRFS